jgi:hypothetical protein
MKAHKSLKDFTAWRSDEDLILPTLGTRYSACPVSGVSIFSVDEPVLFFFGHSIDIEV